MYASNSAPVDAASLATLWSPRLVRFYFLLCANQSVAESLTIETLAEMVRSQRTTAHPVALARLALTKAAAVRTTRMDDARIARAVASLPPSQRYPVALVRGMGLSIDEVAQTTRTSVSESKRLFADGLREFHRLLFSEQEMKLESSSET